jgi:hypothetical protein
MSENHPSEDHDRGGAPDERAVHEPPSEAPPGAGPSPLRLGAPARPGRRLALPGQASAPAFSYEQRLLVLDIWRRSGLPAGDFAPLVGLSKYTLYEWKRRFEAEGPAGLADRPRGAPGGSRLPEVTRRHAGLVAAVGEDLFENSVTVHLV